MAAAMTTRRSGRYIITDTGYRLACEVCPYVTPVKPSKASARGALAAHKHRP